MLHYLNKDTLVVQLQGNFDLLVVDGLKSLCEDAKRLDIDLSASRFINSEAYEFLLAQLMQGREIVLRNPPRLYAEGLDILQLHEAFKPVSITTKE